MDGLGTSYVAGRRHGERERESCHRQSTKRGIKEEKKREIMGQRIYSDGVR